MLPGRVDFTPEGKAKEIEALDAFIDAGEALLSDWKNEYGL